MVFRHNFMQYKLLQFLPQISSFNIKALLLCFIADFLSIFLSVRIYVCLFVCLIVCTSVCFHIVSFLIISLLRSYGQFLCWFRMMNRCWFWDLEKVFPGYPQFDVAENILHLGREKNIKFFYLKNIFSG